MAMASAVETTPGYDRMKAVKEFDESKMGVKGLSDSGIKSIPEIFVHPPHTLSQLKPTLNPSLSLPVVDLSDLNSSNHHHRRRIVDQVREAAKSWGFFQVINHGIPAAIMDGTISAISGFHESAHDIKAKHYKREEGPGVMYSSNDDLYRSSAAAWHDALQVWMGPEPPVPEEIPEVCRREVLAWDSQATVLAETLMELLSEGIGLEKGRFKELTFSEKKLFVGTCYPPCPEPERTVGLTAHTDSTILTVLMPNQVKGLQVKHGDEWVEVSPVPGGLIINIGDFLQIVSNGEYQSVEHCVTANSAEESRISIIMFFHPSRWREGGWYGPLPELITPEKPAIYRDFTQQEFLHDLFSKGFDSKSFIHKIRIHS